MSYGNMTGYTKLFGSIVASTIWRESKETKIVWITMLAVANRSGIVEASVPGLADFARVTIEECELALQSLMSPDKHSRTKEFEGRRIEEVDGGWAILNHAKYRAKMGVDERREYLRIKQQEHRDRQRGVNTHQQSSTPSTPAEAEADAIQEALDAPGVKASSIKSKMIFPKELQGEDFDAAWAEWAEHRLQCRKKLTPLAIKKQLTMLAKLGKVRAIAAINHSITQGYQGIFEPNERNKGTSSTGVSSRNDNANKTRLGQYSGLGRIH